MNNFLRIHEIMKLCFKAIALPSVATVLVAKTEVKLPKRAAVEVKSETMSSR